MASKKYLVRDGFVVQIAATKSDGSTYTKEYNGGEELVLDDDIAAQHLHKLEFASAKDRDAAIAAEQQAKVFAAASQSPVELVQQLIAALSMAQQSAGVAPAAPAA